MRRSQPRVRPGHPGGYGYPQQMGYPPQGYPPQGYPPQAYPLQAGPDQSRFGTVRKKVATDIKLGEQVKTRKNQKGLVKFEGYVEGLGHVLGLDVFLGRGNHDGKFNGKRYFRTKKGRGLFVPKTEITHVYRENRQGVKEKVRYQPAMQQQPPMQQGMPGEGPGGYGGHGGPAMGAGEDDYMMAAASRGLGAINLKPGGNVGGAQMQ